MPSAVDNIWKTMIFTDRVCVQSSRWCISGVFCVFQFVEKRKEMKADGRTDKEMEESYCFLLTETAMVRVILSDKTQDPGTTL